jgi:hypothetical protein
MEQAMQMMADIWDAFIKFCPSREKWLNMQFFCKDSHFLNIKAETRYVQTLFIVEYTAFLVPGGFFQAGKDGAHIPSAA